MCVLIVFATQPNDECHTLSLSFIPGPWAHGAPPVALARRGLLLFFFFCVVGGALPLASIPARLPGPLQLQPISQGLLSTRARLPGPCPAAELSEHQGWNALVVIFCMLTLGPIEREIHTSCVPCRTGSWG